MKHLISTLFLLIFNIAQAQTNGNGATKLGFIQLGEVVFLSDTIEVKYINQNTKKLILDTIYFNPESPIPAKVLPLGEYKIVIKIKNYPKIVLMNIEVRDEKVSFINLTLDGLLNTKKRVKLKYPKSKSGYKNCG